MQAAKIIGSLISLGGSIFLFLGALGVLRMPDTYNRIQAGTKATTLGSILMLLGIGIYHIHWLPQALILITFVLLTNPLSSHALARASHFSGVPMAEITEVDKLEESGIEKAEKEEMAED